MSLEKRNGSDGVCFLRKLEECGPYNENIEKEQVQRKSYRVQETKKE
jgi:hypothetical protein